MIRPCEQCSSRAESAIAAGTRAHENAVATGRRTDPRRGRLGPSGAEPVRRPRTRTAPGELLEQRVVSPGLPRAPLPRRTIPARSGARPISLTSPSQHFRPTRHLRPIRHRTGPPAKNSHAPPITVTRATFEQGPARPRREPAAGRAGRLPGTRATSPRRPTARSPASARPAPGPDSAYRTRATGQRTESGQLLMRT